MTTMSVMSRRSTSGALVGVAAASVGVIYGYDSSNIGAALNFIAQDFGLGDGGKQALATVVVIGEILGAIAAGWVANRIGRKWSMVAVAATYCLFALLSALAPSNAALLGARLLLGVTIGLSVVIVPVFVAESAAPHRRGAMLVAYQVATIVGIIAGYVVGYFLAGASAWRWMLGLAALPALFVTLLVLRMPDTPRWYVTRGRFDEARNALAGIDPQADVDLEIAEMRAALGEASGGRLSEMLRRPWLRATVFVVGLGFLIQITGINAVVYYSPKLFEDMGFSGDFGTLMMPAFVQIAGLAAVIISLFTVDRMGRRPILLGGIAAMVVATIMLIMTYGPLHGNGTAAHLLGFGGLVLFTMGFSFGFGALVWVYAGEAFPARLRSYGSSMMLTSDLVANAIIAAFTLSLINLIGGAGTFAIFGAFALVGFVFVYLLAPETRGRKLEDIQHFWQNGGQWPADDPIITSVGDPR
ncbi:putative sugar transporter [Gordonia rhizosphera NBRC 16068]|uniref:Putative sugar transporter n=2 Tax=Gordonia rhizosphera TaxID=83341 RepID=K6V5W9_9ACTN|nr:putative sugar transporter [Gordonia rhizosphera NBRC 16068]